MTVASSVSTACAREVDAGLDCPDQRGASGGRGAWIVENSWRARSWPVRP